MADRYIDTTFVRAHLGTGYSSAALVTGTSETVLIEGATALVKSALKNSGYPVIATQTPSEVDELVKFGVLAAFREMLAAIPEAAQPLPENWESHFAKRILNSIIDGDFPIPSLDPSTTGAVGGHEFTDPLVTTNNARKTTKTELAGY